MPNDSYSGSGGPNYHYDNERNKTGNGSKPTTLLREEVLDLDGQETIISTEAYVIKGDGSIVRQRRQKQRQAADGRWLPIDAFIAASWTNLEVPEDRFEICLNPFELHDEIRGLYVALDGDVTENGNYLCRDCLEQQKKRLFWKKVLLGLVDPEEF